jgi:hypothetical protein
LKLRALYVDYLDGRLGSPLSIDNSASLAESLIQFAVASYEHRSEHMDGINPEGYEEYRDELRRRVDALRQDPYLAEQYLRQIGDSPMVYKMRLLLNPPLTPPGA